MINKVSSRFFYKKIKTYIFIPALYARNVPCHPKVLRDYFFRIQYTVYSFLGSSLLALDSRSKDIKRFPIILQI